MSQNFTGADSDKMGRIDEGVFSRIYQQNDYTSPPQSYPTPPQGYGSQVSTYTSRVRSPYGRPTDGPPEVPGYNPPHPTYSQQWLPMPLLPQEYQPHPPRHSHCSPVSISPPSYNPPASYFPPVTMAPSNTSQHLEIPDPFQGSGGGATPGSSPSGSLSPSNLHAYGYPDYSSSPSGTVWRCRYPGCSSKSVFTRACDLRKHFNRHTKSLFCRHQGCPQSTKGGFNSKKDRARHEAKHNPGIECEWEGCLRVFSRMDNMKDHVRRIHRKGE